jgi:hypothetical protein
MSLELDLHPNDVAEQLTGRDYISYSASLLRDIASFPSGVGNGSMPILTT